MFDVRSRMFSTVMCFDYNSIQWPTVRSEHLVVQEINGGSNTSVRQSGGPGVAPAPSAITGALDGQAPFFAPYSSHLLHLVATPANNPSNKNYHQKKMTVFSK